MSKIQKNSARRGAAPLWASQNFLTGTAVIQRLLDCSDITPADLVLEIGPGRGHITRQLLPRCGALHCVELDPVLSARLRDRFGRDKRFTLRQGDFLKMPLPAGSYKVFANIPFSQTTAIIRRLTGSDRPPLAAWLVVEWGAAKRFAGAGGENLTSLSLRPFFQVNIAARVPRGEFHPQPRVDAALLELRRRGVPEVPWKQRNLYRSFLERAWSGGLGTLLTKKQISTALKRAGLPPPGIDGTMRYVQWLCLFRCWTERGKR